VGRHNLFGHPASQTIRTLQRAGARVYRTDERGAISFTTDGDAVDVDTTIAPPGANP
jgi:competence protein ComEC